MGVGGGSGEGQGGGLLQVRIPDPFLRYHFGYTSHIAVTIKLVVPHYYHDSEV